MSRATRPLAGAFSWACAGIISDFFCRPSQLKIGWGLILKLLMSNYLQVTYPRYSVSISALEG